MLGIGGKVLIVEDESAIAELIAINLKHHGYEIRHAFDTLEAEALLKD